MDRRTASPEEEAEALRAELAELRKKLEFVQGAVDALPFPMFWKDVESVYVGGNRLQSERAGLPHGGAIEGLSDSELPWTAEESAGFVADDRTVIFSAEPSSQIIETQRLADNAERICQTHKAPLRSASGEVIGVVGWYEDITEREAQERAHALLDERLRQAHKMDSLGSLAGGIAHDFNNLLATMVANLTLAQEALEPDHPIAESLADIERATTRARALVRQILTMSQRRPTEVREVALGDVVIDACRLLRATIPAGIELVTELAPDTPTVAGDPTQLHQIIVNLCTNARFALDDRPSSAARISVGVSRMVLDAAATELLPGHPAPGRFAVLTVRDNGVGMDASTQARIFEPFFTTRPTGQGAGLGMSVVHGIVSGHHGAIAVKSSPGRGTTIRVYFPAADETKVSRPPKIERSRSSQPPRGVVHLLYVDDEPALARAVQRVLQRAGHRVTTFVDPREALEALRRGPDSFDVVALDFNMPHLSGLDLAREALALRPDWPVIIASGFVTAELVEEAGQLGVYRVLNKDNIAAELRYALRTLLDEHAVAPST